MIVNYKNNLTQNDISGNQQHESNIGKLVQQRATATKKNDVNDIDCGNGSIVYGLLSDIKQIDSTGAGDALIVIRL